MTAIAILGLLTAGHRDTVIPIEKCLRLKCDVIQDRGYLKSFVINVKNISKRTLVAADLSHAGGLWIEKVRYDDGIERNYGLNHQLKLGPGESISTTILAGGFSDFKGSHQTVHFEYSQPDGYQVLDPHHVRLKGSLISKKYNLTYSSQGIRVSTVK
ncbi:MAG: hypothetical protein JSS72_01010 [Armatimonadetes bacterium]|nr:hypothetical protein [Armatimonadota bacterium]